MAIVGYDISPLKRVKFKILTTSRHATEGEFVSPIIQHKLYFKILQNYRFDNRATEGESIFIF
jgi:hypothetical protein